MTPECIRKIDLTLLREQRDWLMAEHEGDENAEGLINLCNYVLDRAELFAAGDRVESIAHQHTVGTVLENEDENQYGLVRVDVDGHHAHVLFDPAALRLLDTSIEPPR